MFEDKTEEELISRSVELKKHGMGKCEEREQIASELKQRDLARGANRLLVNLTDKDKELVRDILNGKVVITPEPAKLSTKTVPIMGKRQSLLSRIFKRTQWHI